MSTFTIHAPPPRAGETVSRPERFLFVRDGFHVWAFLLAPLWLLLHRLWLVLVLYLVVETTLAAALIAMGTPWFVESIAGLLVALLVGFEASTLWRWTLAGRGWRTLGFVVGDDTEAAERRFFARWVERGDHAPPPAQPNVPPHPRALSSNPDIIGLFPQPGGAP